MKHLWGKAAFVLRVFVDTALDIARRRSCSVLSGHRTSPQREAEVLQWPLAARHPITIL